MKPEELEKQITDAISNFVKEEEKVDLSDINLTEIDYEVYNQLCGILDSLNVNYIRIEVKFEPKEFVIWTSSFDDLVKINFPDTFIQKVKENSICISAQGMSG